MSATATRRRILVLGGGFAGVQAAMELGKSGRFDVTLVSNRDYLHLFPTTIWIPTRTISTDATRVPLADIARANDFEVLIGSIGAIDADRSVVTVSRTQNRDDLRELVHAGGAGADGPDSGPADEQDAAWGSSDEEELSYDHLVIALGPGKASPPGAENFISLCAGPEAALDLRARMDDLLRTGSGKIAIGFGGNPKDGSAMRGGPAFEFLFNVDHMLRKAKVRDAFELTFFAPMENPGKRMGQKAMAMMPPQLAKRGIPMRTGTPIAGFDADGVRFTDDTRLDADLVMFVPGGSGHPVAVASGLPTNEAGFLTIDDHCKVQGTDNVWAIGDAAAIDGPAWRAKQGHLAEVMARTAAANIIAEETGSPQREGYIHHVAISCLMDIGNGAVYVYRSTKREVAIPLPFIGHWMKKGWGWYARKTKLRQFPRLPGL